MGKNYNKLLARVNFPLYTIQTLDNRHILVAGGGGGAKTGIRNVIEIYEIINDGSICRAEPVTHYETGNEAIMNCTVFDAGRFFLLYAGMEGNCQLYKIKHEIVDDGNTSKNEGESSLRKRKNTSEATNQTSCEEESYPKLCFKIQPLESFQTDFSDEPFQKLVRFSPAAKLLVTGGADGHLRFWKHPNMNKVFDLEAHSNDVDDIDICPNGEKVVSVSRDGHGKVWSMKDGKLITELQYLLPDKAKSGERYIFRSVRFGIVKDKMDLSLFGTLNPAVRKKPPLKSYLLKWDTKQFAMQKIISTGSDMVSAMAVSDDGCFIGIGTQSGGVKMYIGFSLQLVYNVDNIHGIFVTAVNFLPTCDETRRITGGHDASLISISVDNHIIIHNIPARTTMSLLTLLTLFFLVLLFLFVVMDYLNL